MNTWGIQDLIDENSSRRSEIDLQADLNAGDRSLSPTLYSECRV